MHFDRLQHIVTL